MITKNNEMSVGLLTYKEQQPDLNTPRLFIANESKLDSVHLQDLNVVVDVVVVVVFVVVVVVVVLLLLQTAVPGFDFTWQQ
jgi:hypothetical protein